MLEHRVIETPTYYIPIHGTWAIDENQEAWWKVSSAFAKYSKRNYIFQYDKLPPFIWSSDVNGFGYSFLSPKTKNTDWYAGGWALAYYLMHIEEHNRNLIAHSHGLQPVLYCCAMTGIKINNLVSVCSPIRSDMDLITDIARVNIKNWLHIYDASDRTQWLGQISNGRLFGARKSPHADVNHKLDGINHSDVLRVDGRMDMWNKQGWYNWLRL